MKFLFILCLLFSMAACNRQDDLLDATPMGGDFSVESSTEKLKLADFRDKVVILYFGYTFCPDICPTTLSTISKAMKNLTPDEQKLVHIIFISVDPDRDTPERLKTYAKFFHPNISAISGTPDVLAPIVKQYGVSYRKNEPGPGKTYYTIDHSTQSFLIDKTGKLVEFIQHGTSSEEVTKLIKKYL